MFRVPINYLAVILCGVSYMVIGYLWYGPFFGKKWMKLVGVTEKKIKEGQKDMAGSYLLSFIFALIMAYVLAHFIWFTAPGAGTVMIGVKTALWSWLGFVITTGASRYIYNTDNKPWDLYIFDGCFNLVSMVVMGIILSVLG